MTLTLRSKHSQARLFWMDSAAGLVNQMIQLTRER